MNWICHNVIARVRAMIILSTPTLFVLFLVSVHCINIIGDESIPSRDDEFTEIILPPISTGNIWMFESEFVSPGIYTMGVNPTTLPTELFYPTITPTQLPTMFIEIIPTVEYDSLYDLYNLTNGNEWNWKTYGNNIGVPWNFTGLHNPCAEHWYGLQCICNGTVDNTYTSCNIEEITLINSNLNGFLSDSIGVFSQLKVLNISDNKLLTGSIPNSISNLTSLYSLVLTYNDLTGSIPESIGNLTHLSTLALSANRIINTIPTSLFTCTNLTRLLLNNNRISGTISQHIANLSQLSDLSLSNNQIYGSIPTELGLIESLQFITLGTNLLTSTIPNSIFTTSLKRLSLNNNHLVGIIPSMNMSHQLINFDVGNNDLTGSIPNHLGILKKLKTFNIQHNYITGQIPDSIIHCIVLKEINVQYNMLTGSIPQGISNCTLLDSMFLNYNYFTSTIPSDIVDLKLLNVLLMSYNLLSGQIPTFRNNSLIRQFGGAYNLFSGTIPNSLINIHQLVILNLIFNHLTGTVPELTIRRAPGIILYINVWTNMLEGTVPSSYCNAELEEIGIDQNHLTGTIPACLGNIPQLSQIFLDYNSLSGSIPSTYSNLTNLISFYMNNNLFTGHLIDFSKMPALLTLYLQNNYFTGSVSTLLINTTVKTLAFVDISNNQLTGTLPSALFTPDLPLQSFAAASNCITEIINYTTIGSIPSEICALPTLVFLDLDGLSTATSCRHDLFFHTSLSHSFVLTKRIKGGIPNCLFQMKSLNTLHLSGNELEWKFPEDFTMANNLNVLSLSHNKITGTVPSIIYNILWRTLDLSYNRLTGVIGNNITVNENSTLTLQVNRLSGHIPSVLLNLHDISILNGNIFDCDVSRNGLPIYDKDYKIYQCGSQSFDQAMTVWTCFLIITVLFILSVIICMRYYITNSVHTEFYGFFPKLRQMATLLLCFHNKLHNEKYGMQSFCNIMSLFRTSILKLTIILCIIGLPLYGTLTAYFSTLSESYTWTVSAAYLSGQTPALILLCFYMLWLVLLFTAWRLYGDHKKHENITLKQPTVAVTWADKSTLLFICLQLFNGIVMIFVNVGYVYTVLNYSQKVVLMAQLSVSLFKLLWNDYALRYMIQFIRKLLKPRGAHSGTHTSTSAEMPTMTFMVLFNTLIAPCLATAAVDPSCFIDAFVQPSPVTSIFPNFDCSVVDIQNGNCSSAITGTEIPLTIGYDPPYIYNYQCSSAILNNYASVYVYMFLFVAFLKPIVVWWSDKLYRELPPGSVLHILVNATMYSILKPAQIRNLDRADYVLFRKERFILRLLSKLAVFLTFGVVFPPIAVVLCVALWIDTYLNEFLFGKFLYSITDETQCILFATKLQHDCEGTLQLLIMPMLQLVVPFAALFYACFIFDIYGDEMSWRNSLWAFVLMSLTPAIIWYTYQLYIKWYQFQQLHNNDNRFELPLKDGVKQTTNNNNSSVDVNNLNEIKRGDIELQTTVHMITVDNVLLQNNNMYIEQPLTTVTAQNIDDMMIK